MKIEQQDVEHLIAVVCQAGDLVMRMQREGYGVVRGKSNEIDIVTEADVASEQLLLAALEARYPGIPLWGEESNRPPNADEYWIVDPIDGTVNYANGVPYYAVNLAFNRRQDGDTWAEVAVTLELPRGLVYWARQGHGAYVRTPDGQDTRLHVNQVDTLRFAILSTGFPYKRADTNDNNGAEFAYFMPRCSGVRRLGSCALDLALVAAGVFAAHWEQDLNPWDIGPGTLIVREAGGMVTDYDGNPWTPEQRNFVASNGQPALHQAMLDGIRLARAGLTEQSIP